MAQHEQCIIPKELLIRAALEYRGGYTTQRGNGYIREYNPFHPAGDVRGLVPQHRLVMERHLGRLLDRKEVVHHIDNCKQNNSLDNLQLFASQGEHLKHHHKVDGKSKRYDPYFVEKVRQAAEDPQVSLKSLGVSPDTVLRICKLYKIEWKHGNYLTDEQVKNALQGRTTKEAADLLNVHPQTLYNRFDHLLLKRKSPGFLEEQIEAVYKRAIEEGISETARHYDTNRVTVSKALKKAKLWDDYRVVSAQRVGGPQKNRRKPLHKA